MMKSIVLNKVLLILVSALVFLSQGCSKKVELPVEEEVVVLWVATNGYVDDVAVDDVREFEKEYLDHLRSAQPALLKRIADEKALSDDIIAELQKVTANFKSGSKFASKAAK